MRVAAAPVLSISVTVQVVVPGESPAATTTGRSVIEVSEFTETFETQLVSPRVQTALPCAAPLHNHRTWVTFVKLLPVAESVA